MTAPTPPPLVVDSFLVAEGRVTGLRLHEARFTDAVGRLVGAGAAREVPALVERFAAEVPLRGRWFPRWECAADGELRWILREAPAATCVLRVAPEPFPDARADRSAKGPDLEWLAQARAHAVAAGLDDVLLLGPEGVRETTTASIVLWEDEGAVTSDVAMPSTTLAWFAGVLASMGRRCTRRPVPQDELLDAVARGVAWAVNAVHGPRCLVLGDGEHNGDCLHLDPWRARWFADAEPLA